VFLSYGGGRGAYPSTAPEPDEPSVQWRQDRSPCPDAPVFPRFGARGGAVRRSGTKSLRLKICRARSGTWSVHGLSPLPVEHLPSLSASFDYARRECAAAPATIELVIDGFTRSSIRKTAGRARRLFSKARDHWWKSAGPWLRAITISPQLLDRGHPGSANGALARCGLSPPLFPGLQP